MDCGKERVVALVDMDCFYVQVEQRLNPALKNKPCVVAQYKTWKGGGIIAVSYEARAHGVTRNMWADDAKNLCPDLQVARVRESHGKADLTYYREASVEVIEVMSRFAVVERASIDEAYMDLTASVQLRLKDLASQEILPFLLKTTHVQGYPQPTHNHDGTVESAVLDKEESRGLGVQQWLKSLPPSPQAVCPELQLAVGAVIVEEMRAAVQEHTGFSCSAGIAHNKVLAKLACGLNKPNRQTILPMASVQQLFNSLPISKIRNLGGKLGASITETLEVMNMGELTQFSQAHLEQHFGDKTGQWLYELCRGVDYEPVKPRQLPKSIGCSKNFPGKTALASKEQVQHWLHQLALELEERLIKDREMNGRVAKLLTVGVRQAGDQRASSFSRCCALARYDTTKISSDSFAIIKSLNTAGNHQAAWSPALTLLHLSASKFSEAPSASAGGITGFLSSDVTCTQTRFPSTQPSPNLRKDFAPKKPRPIQSFFQQALEKKDGEKVEDEFLPFLQPLTSSLAGSEEGKALPEYDNPFSASRSPSSIASVEKSSASCRDEISSFFQRKNMEKSLLHPQLPAQDGAGENVRGNSTWYPEGGGEDGAKRVEHLAEPTVRRGVKQADGGGNLNLETGGGGDSLDSSSLAKEDVLTCERCRQEVLAWEMPEHTDYHFAVDLQTSFSTSKLASAMSCPPPMAGSSQSSRGKTRPIGKSGSQSKRPRIQGSSCTLDLFFKRT